MQAFVYLRPQSVGETTRLLGVHAQARLLAGGQSLLAAMKLGLNAPSHLIDLQDVPGMRTLAQDGDTLRIGAMLAHADIAASPLVRAFCPMLANLAQGIADQQVRSVGTIGGSLANNDPAACWPAGVLAIGATLVTNTREIAADDFFQGLYGTALLPGELLMEVRFPRPLAAHYRKHEQAASRFALVGVAVARQANDAGTAVRVALTGLGHGVVRWPAAEQVLARHWSVAALDALRLPATEALGDVHASASYRAHLAAVLCRRAVAHLTGESAALPARARLTRAGLAPAKPAPGSLPHTVLAGSHHLPIVLDRVWQGLLDPGVLQRCIPGCEALNALGENQFAATVKVGIGPVSARFQTTLELRDLQPPGASRVARCSLVFKGQAGGLGHGQGTAKVRLAGSDTDTTLEWQAHAQVSGRMAQFGNRLIAATARKMSEEFFTRFAIVVQAGDGTAVQTIRDSRAAVPGLVRSLYALWQRLVQRLFRR